MKAQKNRYSVLVKRPSYVTADPDDTYYAFVTALDSVDACKVARRRAANLDSSSGSTTNPDDYKALLVLAGHQHGLETDD